MLYSMLYRNTYMSRAVEGCSGAVGVGLSHACVVREEIEIDVIGARNLESNVVFRSCARLPASPAGRSRQWR